MPARIAFGSFDLRPAQRQLLIDGRAVPLGARAFDVLLALVERRDRVVSKDELLDLVWPNLVVEENNLSVQISALRKALGADVIATVTGRGYRFALDAEDLPGAPPTAAARAGASGRLVRRVATLALVEVAGHAARVAADPLGTAAAWRAARGAVIEPQAPLHGGRVCEVTSHTALVAFDSAVDALRWALEVQRRMASGGATPGAAAGGLGLAIGVMSDDAIVDDGRLLGEGVQRVARLASLAQAGEVIAGDVVRVLAERKAAFAFTALPREADGDPGERRALAWRVSAAPGAADAASPALRTRPEGRRAGIAVLPFATEGEDAERWFGDGMTEEIIATLSLNRSLLVIARDSTLRYRDGVQRPQQVAAELGVRYLLGGTARRHAGRLRIRAELVDSPGGRVIWADAYEGADADLFEFQARIAGSLAAVIDPVVIEAEVGRARGVPTEHLGAYECVLQGLAVAHSFEPDDVHAAGELFRRATRLDPGYAQAHAHLAWWHLLCVGEGRSAVEGEDARMAIHHAARAAALDPRDALVLSVAGHVSGFLRREFAVAMEHFDRAISLNPNCAAAWGRSAGTLAYLGRGEEALERVAYALRLSPFDPQDYVLHSIRGVAALVAGRPDEAVAWCAKARRRNPSFRAPLRMLVAALQLSGAAEEAAETARELLREEPGFRTSVFGSWYPLQRPHLEHVLAAMRDAGLPD
jgi:TolB-like protein/DNA-binding winged helix-turn-helix (wHTH) protein/Flp pilus assembly protein TadD